MAEQCQSVKAFSMQKGAAPLSISPLAMQSHALCIPFIRNKGIACRLLRRHWADQSDTGSQPGEMSPSAVNWQATWSSAKRMIRHSAKGQHQPQHEHLNEEPHGSLGRSHEQQEQSQAEQEIGTAGSEASHEVRLLLVTSSSPECEISSSALSMFIHLPI